MTDELDPDALRRHGPWPVAVVTAAAALGAGALWFALSVATGLIFHFMPAAPILAAVWVRRAYGPDAPVRGHRSGPTSRAVSSWLSPPARRSPASERRSTANGWSASWSESASGSPSGWCGAAPGEDPRASVRAAQVDHGAPASESPGSHESLHD